MLLRVICVLMMSVGDWPAEEIISLNGDDDGEEELREAEEAFLDAVEAKERSK